MTYRMIRCECCGHSKKVETGQEWEHKRNGIRVVVDKLFGDTCTLVKSPPAHLPPYIKYSELIREFRRA